MKSILLIAYQTLQLHSRSGALWIALVTILCATGGVFYFSGVENEGVADLPLRLKYTLWSLFTLVSIILISFVTFFQSNAYALKLYHTIDVSGISRIKHFFGRLLGFYLMSVVLLSLGSILILCVSYAYTKGKEMDSISFLFQSSIKIQAVDPVTDQMFEDRVNELIARSGGNLILEEEAKIDLKNTMRHNLLMLLPNEMIRWRFLLPPDAEKKPWKISLRAEGQNPDLVIQSRWKLQDATQHVVVEKVVPFTVKQTPIFTIPANTFSSKDKSVELSIYNPEKTLMIFPYHKGPFLDIGYGSWVENAIMAYLSTLIWLFSLTTFVMMFASLFEYGMAICSVISLFSLGLFYDYFYAMLTIGIGKLFFFASPLSTCIQTLSALAPPEIINNITSGTYILLLSTPSFWVSHAVIITLSFMIAFIALPHCELEKGGNLS